LEHGAEVDSKDISGRTPLSYAADSGSIEALRVLLEHGAEVGSTDKHNRTPSYYAILQERPPEVVRFLLEHGADVNAKHLKGQTLLSCAMWRHRSVQVLLDYGAEIHIKDEEGRTALFYAPRSEKNIGIMAQLVGRGADVNAKDNKGWTPLMYYANMLTHPWYNEDFSITFMELLMSRNDLDINWKADCGSMALSLAVSHYNHSIARFLREHGAV
jgi:ankyrin repeat protein